MVAPAYRRGLRRVVELAAVPYGFTLTMTTAGGVLIGTHGPPSFAEAALFLLGATLAFGAVAALAGEAGGAPLPAPDPRWVGLASAAAAFAGLAVAGAVGELVPGSAAFGLVALAATAAYYACSAVGVAVTEGRQGPGAARRRRRPPGPVRREGTTTGA